jgi:hypothetical protein
MGELLRRCKNLTFRPTDWRPTYSHSPRVNLSGDVVAGYLMTRRTTDGVVEYRAMTGYEARTYVFEGSKRL